MNRAAALLTVGLSLCRPQLVLLLKDDQVRKTVTFAVVELPADFAAGNSFLTDGSRFLGAQSLPLGDQTAALLGDALPVRIVRKGGGGETQFANPADWKLSSAAADFAKGKTSKGVHFPKAFNWNSAPVSLYMLNKWMEFHNTVFKLLLVDLDCSLFSFAVEQGGLVVAVEPAEPAGGKCPAAVKDPLGDPPMFVETQMPREQFFPVKIGLVDRRCLKELVPEETRASLLRATADPKAGKIGEEIGRLTPSSSYTGVLVAAFAERLRFYDMVSTPVKPVLGREVGLLILEDGIPTHVSAEKINTQGWLNDDILKGFVKTSNGRPATRSADDDFTVSSVTLNVFCVVADMAAELDKAAETLVVRVSCLPSLRDLI